ncbi:allatotropin-like [Odontomachus brunneus]|uniref:allatotropin-like n=1 Tax=Odontomachus brunneus TaxID=486640 RepID=UPI0013F1946F|nr:allatotropin-like [Odontomachus brunneus]XP_032685184.1 allatotropin-like [Odontomachus brunneus]XP_032685185.1 allatotropin-like [Odontomachus brunneus]
MRAILAIALVFVVGLFIATTTSKSCDIEKLKYPRFIKHRTKVREIRGFKPEYISTAIGFGKREGPVEAPDFGRHEEILLALLRSFPRSGIPAKMLLPVIRTNPALVTKLMQMSMQNADQSDEESMIQRSKSERTHALY